MGSWRVAVLLVAAPGAEAESHGDEAAIRALVAESWKQTAAKTSDPGTVNPAGQMQATSAGGFWELLSPAEIAAQVNDSPNTLEFRPHHVQVRFLGANKDVAYVTFYLSGRIVLGSGDVIPNYRTRASQVMEKIGGKWLVSGAHYSPLFQGSGVVLE